MTGSQPAETQPGVAVSAGDQGTAPIPTDGPTCPRRKWFSRHRDQADHPQDPEQAKERWSRWQSWMRQRAPADGQEVDGKQMPPWMMMKQWRQKMEESGEWPPKDWQQWRQQWHKHCGWHKRTPYVAARVPLDDSRWLEDFYDWH